MVGVDYNDAQWDAFLDQLTVADMDSLIALGSGAASMAILISCPAGYWTTGYTIHCRQFPHR